MRQRARGRRKDGPHVRHRCGAPESESDGQTSGGTSSSSDQSGPSGSGSAGALAAALPSAGAAGTILRMSTGPANPLPGSRGAGSAAVLDAGAPLFGVGFGAFDATIGWTFGHVSCKWPVVAERRAIEASVSTCKSGPGRVIARHRTSMRARGGSLNLQRISGGSQAHLSGQRELQHAALCAHAHVCGLDIRIDLSAKRARDIDGWAGGAISARA